MAPVGDGGRSPSDGIPDDGPDIRLSRDDRADFRDELATVYTTEAAASTVLNQIDFPLAYRPVLQGSNPEQWWSEIFHEFNAGTLAGAPYRRLLRTARRRFPGNAVFQRLAAAYLDNQHVDAGDRDNEASVSATENGAEPAEAEVGPAQSCHVIVRASSEPERRKAAEILASLGLGPHEFWSTAHAVSYRVNDENTGRVRERLEETDLGWTVVPAGEPDYVFQTLYARGPDGRQFRLNDTPAQQTVGNVAASVMEEYPPGYAGPTRSIVVDAVQDDGSGRRLNGDDTLDGAGLRNGSRMRIGVEAQAGALNPKDRQEALHRVRNQLVAYAQAHPRFQVRANSTLLPTEYELEFVQASFGPGAISGDEPVTVNRHVVLMQLGSEFPETPPLVFWLTPIFHPNVFPNYDCDQAREHEAQQGLVCLGALAESYTPSLDFGELCQILVDMAAFRNYSLQEESGQLDAFGAPEVRVNYYDRAAAEWVKANQARIVEIGGRVLFRAPRRRAVYRNVVESIVGTVADDRPATVPEDDPQAGAGAGAGGR